ncbi:ABC transporter G family member 20 [Halotydeus destructor]|nr:ABC transporter G family member 20 [Halotydeus destructor]
MVFLKICQQVDSKDYVNQSQDNRCLLDHKISNIKPNSVEASLNRIAGLTEKQFIRAQRNIPFLVFYLLLPAFEIILFCLCIGREPTGLELAIYNPDNATSPSYSEMFLSLIESEDLNLVFYDSAEEAIEAVKQSRQWAALVIPANFSAALAERIEYPVSPSLETVRDSTVFLFDEMTEIPIQLTVMSKMQSVQIKFVQQLIAQTESFMKPTLSAMTPLIATVTPHIFSDEMPDFRDFMVPGTLLLVAYNLALAHTALSFVNERQEGLMERSDVAGVKSYEYLISHLVLQLVIAVIQTIFLLISVFFIFDMKLEGSLILVAMMVVLQGVTGMSCGYMISAICHDEQAAGMTAMASFYLTITLSGMMWPIEGMPAIFRNVAYILPQTYAIGSMRAIISRGLPLTAWQVYYGFLANGIWIIIFSVSAVLIFSNKRR